MMAAHKPLEEGNVLLFIVNEKAQVIAFFTSCLTQDANGKEKSWIVAQQVTNYVP